MNWQNDQHLLYLMLLLIFGNYYKCGLNAVDAVPKVEADAEKNQNNAKFVVITEDVIPDVENTTQKVIRVNPQELPPIKSALTEVGGDSSLYKIQSLLPAHRNYVNSKHMRKLRPINSSPTVSDTPIVKRLLPLKTRKPKQHVKKRLHFFYNQPDWNGREFSRTMNVHVAPGAYPVYYVVAKTNGRYNKSPIKGFRNEEDFIKYFSKTKLSPIKIVES